MDEIMDIKGLMEGLKEVIATSIVSSGHSATGKAVNSLEVVEMGDGKYAILGVPYLQNIQKGTPPDGRRRAYIGKGKDQSSPEYVLSMRLKDGWLQARGIPEELAYPIAKSIVTNGTETYRQGGEDVWDTNVNNYINEHIDDFLKVGSLMNFETV